MLMPAFAIASVAFARVPGRSSNVNTNSLVCSMNSSLVLALRTRDGISLPLPPEPSMDLSVGSVMVTAAGALV
jgi:hypothetical protein